MKKIIWAFVLIFALIGGFFVLGSKPVSASSIPKTFQWGVTMRPYALGTYTGNSWQKQITKASSLGVGWARITWDYNSNAFSKNTAIINALRDQKINVVLVIEHNPKNGDNNLYQQGYNDGKSIAKYYKGKVKYYQMMNEGGAQSIKNPTSNGQTKSDYNVSEYNKVRDYMKGLSDGIHAGDSSAQRIVTISWTHVGFLDRLVADGVNFDIIGIDWYDWMGAFKDSKLSNGQYLSDKLQSYGKPLMFMEVAAMPSTPAGSQAKTIINTTNQTNFTIQTAQWAWDHRDIVKGFYAFELVDNINNPNPAKDYYGFIAGVKKGSTGILGKARPVYTAYKNFIKSHKK